MNFQKTKVIFFNTIQKELRNKVFLFLFIMTVLGILLATIISNYLFKEFVPGEAVAMIGDKTLDMLFAIIQFWTLIVGMILGSNCIKSDFENKNIISQLLSLPIKRSEYLCARVLGTWAITSFYYLFSYIVALTSFSIIAGSFVGSLSIFPAFLVTGLSTLGVICFAVFLSFYLPKLFTFMATFFSYVFVAYCNAALQDLPLSETFNNLSFFRLLGVGGNYLLPQLGNLNNISQSLLLGTELSESLSIPMTLGHYAITFTLIAFVINWSFKKIDI